VIFDKDKQARPGT